MNIASKLPHVGTTIFSTMTRMAKEYEAINLSQGFPDFPVNPLLIDAVHKNMESGKNQYAPMPGLPALQDSISEMINGKYGFIPDPGNNITITSGATEALFSVFQALIAKDDEVIIFDPAYDHYDPAIRLSGGTPIHVPLSQPDFRIDWSHVKEKISKNTKAILINTPHNPTGAVIAADDIFELEKLSEEHDLLVISDEVYEWLVFDGLEHQSILKSEILRRRGVAIFSFGKTFHATGWKVGYAIASENLTREIRKAHQFITFSVNTPVQHALAEFIREPENYEYLPDFFQKKRDFFLSHLKDSGFEIIPSRGTYFQLLQYGNISDKSDMEMAEWLVKEHKVASIPVSVFYADKRDYKMLRFCFAKNEETLEQSAEILCKI